MTEPLNQKKCVPCEGGIPPLTDEQEDNLIGEISTWEIVREGTHKLAKNFKFKDYQETLQFINRVGEVAEAEDHHPNISFTWGKALIEIYTHTIGGLTENDFILAAKIDKLN